MAAPRGRLSLVQDHSAYASSCGYCGTRATHEDSSWSHGMMAELLTAEAYQALIDRGWRRSGRWLYQPINERTCCQLLTIRLNVHNFKPNKEQRRAVRKWEDFLAGALLSAPAAQHQHQEQHQEQGQQRYLADHGLQENPDGILFPAPSSTAPLGEDLVISEAAIVAATGAEEDSPARPAGEGSSRGRVEAGLNSPQLRGASPKRPHDELDYGSSGSGVLGMPAAGNGGELASKRQRGPATAASSGDGAAQSAEGEWDLVEGGSPTARLATQMQQVLSPRRSSGLGGPAAALAPGGGAAAAGPGQVESQALDGALAASLNTALQRCVAEQQLPGPANGYPAAKVQQPNAKQRKVLGAGVAYTSAFPLAVAAAARRLGAVAGSAAAVPPTPVPEGVAQLLLQRVALPEGVTAQQDRGHLNFYAASNSGEAPDVAAAGGAAESNRSPKQQQQPQHERRQGSPPQQGGGPAAEAGLLAGPSASGSGSGVPRGVTRHFEFRMVQSDASVIPVEFELYKKYQVVHHGDDPSDVSMSSFKRFLCDSPIRFAPADEYTPGGAPPCGYGSFHQQYWIDGRLLAVGVVDILPTCLSSVYLFWDPDLAPLSLGKVSALKEIEWVAAAAERCPALRYYYLGFYIHNCHRMRYKGDYAPADLLCPKNKCWVPLDRCRHALDQPGMVAISELPGTLEGLGEDHLVENGAPVLPPAQPNARELDSAKLFIQSSPLAKGQMVTLGTLVAAGLLPRSTERSLRRRLAEWMQAVGPCWPSILYHV